MDNETKFALGTIAVIVGIPLFIWLAIQFIGGIFTFLSLVIGLTSFPVAIVIGIILIVLCLKEKR